MTETKNIYAEAEGRTTNLMSAVGKGLAVGCIAAAGTALAMRTAQRTLPRFQNLSRATKAYMFGGIVGATSLISAQRGLIVAAEPEIKAAAKEEAKAASVKEEFKTAV